jgi:hypothetical protein
LFPPPSVSRPSGPWHIYDAETLKVVPAEA